MSFKPTTLIVCADLDDLQNKKRALIDKYEKTDKFEKWSDYAVELKERLFVFKVINGKTFFAEYVLNNIDSINLPLINQTDKTNH